MAHADQPLLGLCLKGQRLPGAVFMKVQFCQQFHAGCLHRGDDLGCGPPLVIEDCPQDTLTDRLPRGCPQTDAEPVVDGVAEHRVVRPFPWSGVGGYGCAARSQTSA